MVAMSAQKAALPDDRSARDAELVMLPDDGAAAWPGPRIIPSRLPNWPCSTFVNACGETTAAPLSMSACWRLPLPATPLPWSLGFRCWRRHCRCLCGRRR
jgi:hypothetical protein